MRATMMLCDAAQEVGGKLFILGGGWTIRPVEPQALMSIAIKLYIGWNEANQRIDFSLQLMSEDGRPVLSEGNPVRVDGTTEVGRPPGSIPGSDLDAALAITLGFKLEAGSYRWEFLAGGNVLARESFLVRATA